MAAGTAQRPSLDDLDNYNVDLDDDDPFRSPSPQPGQNKDQQSQDPTGKKRKSDALGIDEEVDVTKRARVPRVKLDETRLLSEDGIPKLRKRARDLRFKGKGHEFSDAARLLSFYQFWLDGLFPKAKFLDALAMVEKAGHKRVLASQRLKWIDETKPKSSVLADDGDDDRIGTENTQIADATAATPDAGARARTTPGPNGAAAGGGDDDVPDDLDDLFEATPIRSRPQASTSTNTNAMASGAPDDDDGEDDLDALMAEAEMNPTRRDTEGDKAAQTSGTANGAANAEEDGLDDLDALMAETEAGHSNARKDKAQGGQDQRVETGGDDTYADDEAAMAEMGGLW